MVRIALFFTCIISFTSFGQEQYFRPGTLKGSATIAPSIMLNRDVQNIYLNGFIDYQLDKNFSLRGETFFYVKSAASATNDVVFNNAINTYFGAFYHRGIGNWDNYAGFEPGVAAVKIPTRSKVSICPTFALKIGTAYYVWKYFHFFADLTYTNLSIRGDLNGSLRSDELIISAGLGFQINTHKASKAVTTPNF